LMRNEFAIVDLFAGPGGLAEGFASIRDRNGARPFRVVLSVEKEASAFETLRLRSFLRQFPNSLPIEYYRFLNGEIAEPDWGMLFPDQWGLACRETLKLELGLPEAQAEIDGRLAQISTSHQGNVILIGGPPCQAYSLVGRARNRGIRDYEASKDQRHLVRMPVLLLSSLGNKADHLLASPPSVLPEIREQLTSQQDMFAPAFQAVARALYFDEEQQKLKRGSGSKGAGSPRRLATVRKQLDVTWDLYEVPSERLVWMLPKDFDRFRSSEGQRSR